jgi:outer membrane protein OmpA-like peptidoglycan-associated protein/uncharacterized protein YidB (DUF937 family)
MFEQLVNEAASRFTLSSASATSLVRAVLSLITDQRSGGFSGFIDLFRRANLGDIVSSWYGGSAVRPISGSQIESALGGTTLDSLGAASGLSRGVVTSALAFLLPKIVARLTPGGVLPSNRDVLTRVAAYLEPPQIVERQPEPIERAAVGRRGFPAWLPWAAAAALALAALIWLRPTAGTVDPQLTISNRDGKVTYAGVVRDRDTRDRIVAALHGTFGEGNVQGDLRVDRRVRPIGWLPRTDSLVAALKTPGVDFELNGDRIAIGGWLSASDRRALTSRLQDVLGRGTPVASLGDAASDAARAANDKALTALRAVGTSGVAPSTLLDAMNMSVITFASGSAEIPPDGMEIIRTSAEALKQAPAGSVIEIRGHTDNTGDGAANLALSEARAEAVRDALVMSGVPASMLRATGYGDTKPRAPNDTEYGRFQNRRIEYALAATEKAATIRDR